MRASRNVMIASETDYHVIDGNALASFDLLLDHLSLSGDALKVRDDAVLRCIVPERVPTVKG